MREGFIVMHWQATLPETPAIHPSSSSSQAPDLASEDVFCHVTLHYERPWTQTVCRLSMTDEDIVRFQKYVWPADEEAHYHQHSYFSFHVAAAARTPQVCTIQSFLKSLDLQKAWHVRLWCLSQRQAPCKQIAGIVAAKPLPLASLKLWFGPKYRKSAHQVAAQRWLSRASEDLHEQPTKRRRVGVQVAPPRADADSERLPPPRADDDSEREEEVDEDEPDTASEDEEVLEVQAMEADVVLMPDRAVARDIASSH